MASVNLIQTVELHKGYSKKSIQSIGKKFGKLTVLEYLGYYIKPSGTHTHVVLCECDCGVNRKCDIYLLTSNQLKSCGCYSYKWGTEKRIKHGCAVNDNDTPEYIAWMSMKNRCYFKKNKSYKNYGERGIKVCDRWINSFENFLFDMGIRPSPYHSLDRYPNKSGDYEPKNCRWATIEQQNNNTRRNKLFIINGEKITQAQASRKYKISIYLLNKNYVVSK